MNDNNSDKGIRIFHAFFMVFSAALILSGLFLAWTMINGALQSSAEEAAQDISVVAREENMPDAEIKPMPQMFTLPGDFGQPGGGMDEPVADSESGVVDMNSVAEEKKDDLALPLFDERAQEGGEVKPLTLPEPAQPEE